jgi:hypothetical protein
MSYEEEDTCMSYEEEDTCTMLLIASQTFASMETKTLATICTHIHTIYIYIYTVDSGLLHEALIREGESRVRVACTKK